MEVIEKKSEVPRSEQGPESGFESAEAGVEQRVPVEPDLAPFVKMDMPEAISGDLSPRAVAPEFVREMDPAVALANLNEVLAGKDVTPSNAYLMMEAVNTAKSIEGQLVQ